MEKKFKFGILGLMRGRAPLASLTQLKDYVEITAVCEMNEKTLEEMKPSLPETAVIYQSFEEMIASGIDAVVLCDFFHTHFEFAIKAIKKGVAVFSETTAAPSLGGLVDLVEAVEEYGGKYMLMANCPYFKPIQLAKKMLKEGKYGELIYAEGEYVHPTAPEFVKQADLNNLHWRQTNPGTYYNMHSLGPLMYAAEALPVKVSARAVVREDKKRPSNTPKTFVLTEMDNGAVFNSTGCVRVGSLGKWYRFACENGTMETERLVEEPAALIHTGIDSKEITRVIPSWSVAGALTKEEEQRFEAVISSGGHGGCDAILFIDMIKYLTGEAEPFFNVYNAAALSAAGILGWYSILNGGREYDIPDFRIKEERDKIRGDYRMPFAKRYEDLTLPCRVDK